MFTDDELENASPRDYICDRCYLLYSGKCPWDEKDYRRPCPHCGDRSPHATDTFGCAYWERGMAKKHGDDFFKNHYWFKPEWLDERLVKHYRSKGITEGHPPKKES